MYYGTYNKSTDRNLRVKLLFYFADRLAIEKVVSLTTLPRFFN